MEGTSFFSHYPLSIDNDRWVVVVVVVVEVLDADRTLDLPH